MSTWPFRRRAQTIPENERCSFCANRAVGFTSSVNATRPEGIRRCLDHPPLDALQSVCGHCGQPFWPDFLHLDCPADAAEVS
jgi:hypothetical protein